MQTILQAPIPVYTQNALTYIFARATLTKAPFDVHTEFIPLSDSLYQKYHTSETWLLGSIRNDCRTQWVLTVSKLTHSSQTCRSSRWNHCLLCPFPRFIVRDLSDKNLHKTWGNGSVSFIDEAVISNNDSVSFIDETVTNK